MIRSADTRERMERFVKDFHLTWLEKEGQMLGKQTPLLLGFLRRIDSQSPVPSPQPPVPRPERMIHPWPRLD